MTPRVVVKINPEEIAKKYKKNEIKARTSLSEQVLEDSNFFIKQDQGQLKQSGHTSHKNDKSEVIWSTPYAKRQYYTGTPSKDVNPNASLMWFAKAKKMFINNWTTLYKKAFFRSK